MSIKILKGKFVNNKGVVIKPEFGNIEQIKLIQKYSLEGKDVKMTTQVKEEIKYYATTTLSFPCEVCKKIIEIEGEGESMKWENHAVDSSVDDIPKEFEVKCSRCDTEYDINYIDERKSWAYKKYNIKNNFN